MRVRRKKSNTGKSELLALLTLFFITGLTLLIKGNNMEVYMNTFSLELAELQKVGLYFLSITVGLYLLLRIVNFFQSKGKINKIMGFIIIIVLVNLFILTEPLIFRWGLYLSFPSSVQTTLVTTGLLAIFILIYLIISDIFHIVTLYLQKSKDIDSKASILLSLFALAFSILSVIFSL